MQTEKKKILLISYVFPPYPGIGGRRWAKFAKYLTRNGYTVHVICSENSFKETSLWNTDIDNNPKVVLHPLSSIYPAILQIRPVNIFQKLKYFIYLKILPLISKGTIYDRALFWEKQLLNKANELIVNHQIQNVIVSGAPFNLNYYATKLKKIFPNINLISDFRDPWTWGPDYGYSSLPQRKQEFEKVKEFEVVSKSNFLTVPVQVMKDLLQKNYNTYAEKIILLPHAYDSDEVYKTEKSPSEKLRIVFYGSIYDNLDDYINAICEVLKRNKDEVKLDFYSDSTSYQELFKSHELSKVVSYYPLLNGKELFSKFKDYDYVLLIYPDDAVNYLTSKFFEIIESKTPFLYIGKSGYTADFIKTNNVGIHFAPSEIKSGLQNLIKNKDILKYNYDFDVSDYSFSNVTKDLMKLFI